MASSGAAAETGAAAKKPRREEQEVRVPPWPAHRHTHVYHDLLDAAAKVRSDGTVRNAECWVAAIAEAYDMTETPCYVEGPDGPRAYRGPDVEVTVYSSGISIVGLKDGPAKLRPVRPCTLGTTLKRLGFPPRVVADTYPFRTGGEPGYAFWIDANFQDLRYPPVGSPSPSFS